MDAKTAITFARLAHECGYRLMLETEDGSGGVELYGDDDKRPKRV